MATTIPETPPDPEDISKILRNAFEAPADGALPAAGFRMEVDLDGVDVTDNSLEETLIQDDAKRDGVQVPELPKETPLEPESVFDSDPVGDSVVELTRAFHADFDFGSVDITAEERDRFYRCGLHDQEMWYDVDVPGSGMVVRVAMPPTSRSEAAIAAIEKWVTDGHIGSSSVQYLHGFQILNVWLMVRAVNGEPTDWYDKAVSDAGGKLGYRALRNLLADPDSVDAVRDVGEVRWQAVTLAVRIADHKHQLCLEAIRTRRVFTTAGSA